MVWAVSAQVDSGTADELAVAGDVDPVGQPRRQEVVEADIAKVRRASGQIAKPEQCVAVLHHLGDQPALGAERIEELEDRDGVGLVAQHRVGAQRIGHGLGDQREWLEGVHAAASSGASAGADAASGR